MSVQARGGGNPKGPWYFPGSYWFPAAAAWAAVVLPWSVLGQLGMVPVPPALGSGPGHAHEMLFGFALAVVAGYTLVPGRGRAPLALLLLWLAARASFLLAPMGWWALACNGLFAVGLALLVAPVYLRAAKWSNRSVALIVLALALAALAFHALGAAARTAPLHALLLAAVLLLSTLMFFMGGRILAPAIAGHVRSQGAVLRHVVQPGLEAATLALLAVAVAATLLPWRGARTAAALLLLASALLTLLRMLRWRIWRCRGQADLLALLAGYGWLVAGWLLIARALLAQEGTTPALHAITVGALGTLTFSVMLRTQMFRAMGDANRWPLAYLGAVPMAAAALLRIGGAAPWRLAAAALCWAACHGLLVALLVALHGQKKPRAARSAAPARR